MLFRSVTVAPSCSSSSTKSANASLVRGSSTRHPKSGFASNHDSAERFATDVTGKMFGEKRSGLGGDAQSFMYPSMLYRQGQESFREGVEDLLIPPVAKLAAGAGQFIQTQIQEALPKPPAAFEDIPDFQLQQFAIDSAVDYEAELRNNPNSRLLPRLKKIKDDYWRATKARGLSN